MTRLTGPSSNFVVSFFAGLTALMTTSAGVSASDGERRELSIETIQKLDLNKDGCIGQGAEGNALGALFDEMSDYQKAQYFPLLSGEPNACVKVTDFQDKAWYQALDSACEPGQRFFLRDKIVDASLLQPGLHKAGGKQATFSVSQDELTDTLSWSVNGAVTTVPVWDNCQLPDGWTVDQMALSGIAIAPSLEFSGSGNSNQKGPSSLRFAANTELQFLGGLFDLQQVNLIPFYQTDFDFAAEIYGFKASWYPVRNQFHLGGFVGVPDSLQYWWTLQATADFLSVQEPGSTKFTQGTEYGWLGAEIGAHAEYKALFADVSYNFRQDVINNVNADLFEADAGVYLDPEKRVSITANYKNGTQINTLSEVNKITLQFGFKF